MWQVDPLRPVGVTVAAYESAEPNGDEFVLSGLGSDPITRGLFHNLRMAEMIDRSRWHLLMDQRIRRLELPRDGGSVIPMRFTALGDELLEADRAGRRKRSAERGHYGDPAEHLRQVADAYRRAFVEDPRRAALRTAEILRDAGVIPEVNARTRGQVRTMILRARASGLLPKTEERRAGWTEAPAEGED